MIKDHAEIQAHKHSHDVARYIIALSYVCLVFGCINAFVVMIGTVFTIGFLAETPPTLEFCHILLGCSPTAITAVCFKGLDTSVKGADKVKSGLCSLMYVRAASTESRELPT